MKKYLFLSLVLTLAVTIPAKAQTGCDDSPENPTLVLAGLAGGVYAANSLRMRLRARRAVQNRGGDQ